MPRIKYLYQGEYTFRQITKKGILYLTTSKGDSEDFKIKIFDEVSLTPLSIFEEHVEKASRHFGFDIREYETQFLGEEVAKVTKKVPPLVKVYNLVFSDGARAIKHFECGCEVSGSGLTNKCSGWCGVTPSTPYTLSEHVTVHFPNLSRPKGEVSLRTTSEGYYVLRIRYEGYTVYATDDDRYLYSHEIIETYPDAVEGVLRGRLEGDWVETPY